MNAALGRVNGQGDGADQGQRASAVNAALGRTGGVMAQPAAPERAMVRTLPLPGEVMAWIRAMERV